MASENSSAGKTWATTMMVLGVLGLVVAVFGLVPPYWSTFFNTPSRADVPGAQQDAAPPVPSDTAPRPDAPAATYPPPGDRAPANDEPAQATSQPDPPAADDPGGRGAPADDGAREEPDLPEEPEALDTGHSGPLNVSIDMGTRGKVGPATYRRGATPGANTKVYDRAGRIDTGCYVQWILSRGDTVVQTETSDRCRPPGVTLFNFGDSLDEVGGYRLTADVTTDWGEKGSATATFTVVAGD
ncbi:hypothetical protein [Streptomyces ficellus]|uniref:Uncharacterized protein n=1 Tax=Streptomyces ficellus TaxID=1977088 RepID=A0A6I6FFC0_9ACTN|nr:hypothetical protein [Streptomyces ficellus]QGV82350.1 hypothetical protein EIZ62_31920 [Streptomyces ficellus]